MALFSTLLPQVAQSGRFKRAVVLEKDFNLRDMHEFARQHIFPPGGPGPDIHPQELNLWYAVLRIRIRDPVPFFYPWIRDPGWVKSQDPYPGSDPG
jgi:hypothetical protein